MRKKWMRFPVLIACAALAFALAFQTAEPVYAAVSTDPTGLQVTGYTVSPATGSITKGTRVTITVSILDSRITAAPIPSTITASLNTSSFTGPNGTIPAIGTGNPGEPTIVSGSGGGLAYTVTFSGLTYTGVGNTFSCSISYGGLTPPLPVGSVSITLNQCVEYVPSDPVAPPDEIIKPTDFILKDARFGDGTVYAGEQFVLSVVILATNGTAPVENVAVTFAPPEQLTLADGSSVVYIGTMGPNTTTSASTLLLASANIQEGSYPVTIIVNGVNQRTGMQVSAQMTVSIPVLQPERFEIFDAMLPSDLTAGFDDGMGFSTVTLVNKGKGAVANVTVEIVGEGLRTDAGRQYLGNVGGGEQKIADFILYADIPGQIDAYVVVWYENVRGEQMSLERPFTVNVNEPWFEDPGDWDPGFPMPEEPVSTGPPTWFWIVVGAAAAAVVAILLVRRNKKKKAAAEAALDYEDDDD